MVVYATLKHANVFAHQALKETFVNNVCKIKVEVFSCKLQYCQIKLKSFDLVKQGSSQMYVLVLVHNVADIIE